MLIWLENRLNYSGWLYKEWQEAESQFVFKKYSKKGTLFFSLYCSVKTLGLRCVLNTWERCTDSLRMFRVGFFQHYEHECVLLVSHAFPCGRYGAVEGPLQTRQLFSSFRPCTWKPRFYFRFWQMEKSCLKFWHQNLQFHASSIQHPLRCKYTWK